VVSGQKRFKRSLSGAALISKTLPTTISAFIATVNAPLTCAKGRGEGDMAVNTAERNFPVLRVADEPVIDVSRSAFDLDNSEGDGEERPAPSSSVTEPRSIATHAAFRSERLLTLSGPPFLLIDIWLA
jgi:hypothetical protein